MDYAVRQSGNTVANLRSFAGFLETAKAAGVGPVTLPADVKGRIDDVVRKVGAAADVLAARTSSNAAKIRAALETVYVTDPSMSIHLLQSFASWKKKNLKNPKDMFLIILSLFFS